MVRRNAENNDRRTEQFRKLFVGGLTPPTDENKLKEYYSQWGEIVDVVVMKDSRTNRSRGFGFVTFKEAEMVDEAQQNRPHEIDGKIVEAKRAMPREDSTNPESHMTVTKLFVGGLKKDVTTEELKSYFSSFGNITEAEVVTWKESGDSRGFGFVTFDDYDPVDKAILYKPHHIGSSRADVKKALSKEQMQEINMKKQQSNYGGQGGNMGGAMGGGFRGGFSDGYGGGFGGNMGGGGWNQGGGGGNMGGGWGNQGGGWGNQGQMAGGGAGWGGSGMGDGFGNYGNQQFGGGPVRGGGGQFNQRNTPYGGGYGRR